jgi:hypothetical protein
MKEVFSELGTFGKALALLGIIFAITSVGLTGIGAFTEEWTSYCNVNGHWVKKYNNLPDCFADAQLHHKQTGHASGCKRSDWPMVALDRLLSFMATVTGHPRHET